MPESLRLERIVWLDHMEPNGDNVWWTAENVADVEGPSVIVSVGWVIREEATWLMTVAQVTDDGCTSRPLVIVKSCITSRELLKEDSDGQVC